MTIVSHSNESQTRWDRGDFQVLIESPTSSQPIGFCDGSLADENEILAMAMREGAEVEIDKKLLKTGRQKWTVRRLASSEDDAEFEG
ncbi:MAG: hypothetical protein H0U74_08850 [Bradymonadaceae bacterium]|nr:hypothetical protein [Lujinxingiaceae bacterium]